MEEVVGKIWDKWLTRQVSTDFPDSQIKLETIQSQLQIFYRSLGGDKTKTFEALCCIFSSPGGFQHTWRDLIFGVPDSDRA